jgi:hypothetical protein
MNFFSLHLGFFNCLVRFLLRCAPTVVIPYLFVVAPTALCAEGNARLFFREDWKETPAATPITQEHVANPNLVMTRYGAGEMHIKKSHHNKPADDPYYVWSGEGGGNWAASLRHKTLFVDLSGSAKIRWRTKQSGFRQLHLILKLSDGQWIVSEQYDGESSDWHVREFNLQDVRWRTLDIEKVVEGNSAPSPDLSKVDEIGWTDLMSGGGTPASSRLDWIEVYGKAVQPLAAERIRRDTER